MVVRYVVPDINDYTMSLPESILTLLNADLKSGSKIAWAIGKTILTAGTKLVKSQLLNYRSDMIVAMGNSKGIVIKVENRDNRRIEVSYKDKIWVQRVTKD